MNQFGQAINHGSDNSKQTNNADSYLNNTLNHQVNLKNHSPDKIKIIIL